MGVAFYAVFASGELQPWAEQIEEEHEKAPLSASAPTAPWNPFDPQQKPQYNGDSTYINTTVIRCTRFHLKPDQSSFLLLLDRKPRLPSRVRTRSMEECTRTAPRTSIQQKSNRCHTIQQRFRLIFQTCNRFNRLLTIPTCTAPFKTGIIKLLHPCFEPCKHYYKEMN